MTSFKPVSDFPQCAGPLNPFGSSPNTLLQLYQMLTCVGLWNPGTTGQPVKPEDLLTGPAASLLLTVAPNLTPPIMEAPSLIPIDLKCPP